MMKKIYLFFTILLLATLCPVLAVNVSGNISGSVTWGPGTINVVDDLSVEGSLTIMEGTTVIFSPKKKITVQASGKIIANGTVENPILFKALDPEMGWRGINFIGQNGFDEPPSEFHFCHFEDGLADGEYPDPDTELMGGAIYIFYHKSVSFYNCTFLNNSANLAGGALGAYYSGLILSECLFKNNQTLAAWQTAGAIHLSSNEDLPLEIVNCAFYNNSAYAAGAISAEHTTGLKIVGSVFANNQANHAAAIMVSQITRDLNMLANTFTHNHCIDATKAPIHLPGAQGVQLINNIFYNDADGTSGSSEIIFLDNPENLTIKNCLIRGGLASVNGLPTVYSSSDIIDGDPAFVSPTATAGLSSDGSLANWQLSAQSPCVNSGPVDISGLGLPTNDIDGNLRLQQGRIDIGAFESAYTPTNLIKSPLKNDFKVWYCTDLNGIVVKATNNQAFTLCVYNLSGTCLYDGKGRLFSGETVINEHRLNAGIYIVSVLNSKHKALKTSKIVVYR